MPAPDPLPTPVPVPVAPTRSLAELAGPAVAGFVVYTTEQSIVIPVDGSGPVKKLYSESLVERPDNATTKRRLEEVRRSLP